jgi:hypothetical protein
MHPMKGLKVIDELCNCGHLKSDHWNDPNYVRYRSCQQCGTCSQFTFKKYVWGKIEGSYSHASR